MKPIVLHFAGAIALSFTLAACIPAVDTRATSTPATNPAQSAKTDSQAPVVATPLPPTSVAATAAPDIPSTVIQASETVAASVDVPENWMDAPRTLGDWIYERESSETFAIYASRGETPHAIIRCDLATGRVGIGRYSINAPSATMRIMTETRQATLTATKRDSRLPLVAAEVDPQNRLLDAMAITKGNFAMHVVGMPTLYLPGWAEVTRIIEDCR